MENIEKAIDIVILVNGPGELASFVRPAVEALNRKEAKKRITLVFTPCPYSTGKETDIAKRMAGVSNVISAGDFISWMLFKRRPSVSFGERGIVVFFGGDILYGKMLAKRLKYPAIAYSESYAKWPKVYRKFLVPDVQTLEKFKRQGFPAEKIKIVGNLMVDSIRPSRSRDEVFKTNGFDEKKKLVTFMPGSREFQVKFTFKFFRHVARAMAEKNPRCQFCFVISPYLPEAHLEKHLKNAGLDGIRIIRQEQFDVIKASDLVITIPGTNTAEVAVIGTPMIVVFPLASAQLIPLEGINDLIGRLPIIGFFFKNLYVKIVQSKTRFFAIPNIKSGREITPEVKGSVTPEDIAMKALLLLEDGEKLGIIRKELKEALGGPGASERIAEEIINEALL